MWGRNLRNITFNLSDMHLHGSAFYDFLKLRKRFFVDGLGWDIPTDGEVEMDQYDTPRSHYSVVVSDGQVIAGARTQSTTASWNQGTCMLYDAATTGLPGIPKDLIDPSICSPDVWECTRLVVSDDVRSTQQRIQCLALVVDGLIRTIQRGGGDKMVSFSPLALPRTLRLVGVEAHRVSEAYTCQDDGRSYAVFRARAERPVARLAELGIDTIKCETIGARLAAAL